MYTLGKMDSLKAIIGLGAVGASGRGVDFRDVQNGQFLLHNIKI